MPSLKAGNIAGCITVCAELNPKVIHTRHSLGWMDEVTADMSALIQRVPEARANKEVVSTAYHGNVEEIWEAFAQAGIYIGLGSDQTSLHDPWAGGYYSVNLSFEEVNRMMAEDLVKFKEEQVQESL